MAKESGIGGWIGNLKPISRRKKDKDQGGGVARAGKAAGVARAGESAGGAARLGAEKKRVDYMKKRLGEKRAATATEEAKAEQLRKNKAAVRNMQREVAESKRAGEAPDRGALWDFAGDYVPMDDRLGKAANAERIRKAYRNRNKK